MTIEQVMKHANRLMGHGMYNEHQLIPYFDECVDAINQALNINLPTFTKVYENDFQLNDTEDSSDFAPKDTSNPYTRIPDKFLRNYVCYEASYRLLRDEDEDPEVYQERAYHARDWFQKMVSQFSGFVMEDTESVIVNGDVDEINSAVDTQDDTAMGFYNPYFEEDDS